MSSIYFVRDHESRDLLGARTEVRPDMAFADELIETNELRNVIAVSLRDAGPEVVEQLRALKHLGEEHSLEMVLVTQVKFDDQLHRQLALSLGVSHVAWDDRSHSEQLQDLSRVYSRSVAVVSNRLHALILGLQAGSAAVAVNPDKHPKLVSTLDGRMPFCELSELLSNPTGLLGKLTSLRSDSRYAWEGASRELADALSSAPGRTALQF
uniref:Polysaccharide pyruvyl transferase domain-containing protein n=1 Tax=Kocuria rosea subsp. polaris TaxID=136273 RepID=A0A0A6VR96_KOCRO|nr:hypothetical protein GY22_09445 [Kocuria polaris]